MQGSPRPGLPRPAAELHRLLLPRSYTGPYCVPDLMLTHSKDSQEGLTITRLNGNNRFKVGRCSTSTGSGTPTAWEKNASSLGPGEAEERREDVERCRSLNKGEPSPCRSPLMDNHRVLSQSTSIRATCQRDCSRKNWLTAAQRASLGWEAEGLT